ncbi:MULTISPECIES: hypothetical protein [Limnospira]|uniref:hypothetical protein n=1 Tax=Limnospira TaxID=2596745 RepID=UPI0001D0EF9E|nr:hypothetical protein [Arthrospira platensis]MDF2210180.1 hypothetical protein [Arthrospira platensis NCB002]MDT9185445.1 hypothetical protein [Limnospira sp. PMC 289.06]BAI89800.1 hypothetical protein NIES39_D03820 [Arthrospira platensis NIES-39]
MATNLVDDPLSDNYQPTINGVSWWPGIYMAAQFPMVLYYLKFPHKSSLNPQKFPHL